MNIKIINNNLSNIDFENKEINFSAIQTGLIELIINNDLYNFDRVVQVLKRKYTVYYHDKKDLNKVESKNSYDISKMIYNIASYLIDNEYWDFVVSVLDLSIVLKGNSHFDNNNTDLIDGDINKVIFEYLLIIDEIINKKQDRFIGGYIGHYIIKYYRAKTVQNFIEIIDDYILNNNPLNKRYAIENLESKINEINKNIDESHGIFSSVDAEQSLKDKNLEKQKAKREFYSKDNLLY